MHLKEQVMSSLFLSDQELIAQDFSACTSVDPGEQCEARKTLRAHTGADTCAAGSLQEPLHWGQDGGRILLVTSL